MISTTDFRNGTKVELDDGDVWVVLFAQHHKPGKGGAVVRTKMKNLRTGSTVERTFRAGEKVKPAVLDRRDMQYLYKDTAYNFMDLQTYEQVALPAEALGDAAQYLKENMTIGVLYHKDRPISVEIPNFVELKVVQTDPGLRGDTASGGSKPATMESGVIINVPLFIEIGEVLKVDTRTGAYIERVKG